MPRQSFNPDPVAAMQIGRMHRRRFFETGAAFALDRPPGAEIVGRSAPSRLPAFRHDLPNANIHSGIAIGKHTVPAAT